VEVDTLALRGTFGPLGRIKEGKQSVPLNLGEGLCVERSD
jgi:hypothetical protein